MVRKKPTTYTKHVVNSGWFKRGNKTWNTGQKSNIFKGKSIDGLHEWVYRVLGSPSSCEHCSGSENLEWANRSGKYKQDKTDWIRLCKKCHHKYDFEQFGARTVFYKGGNPIYL